MMVPGESVSLSLFTFSLSHFLTFSLSHFLTFSLSLSLLLFFFFSFLLSFLFFFLSFFFFSQVAINLTILVDQTTAPALNMGQEKLEDIVIFHIEDGKVLSLSLLYLTLFSFSLFSFLMFIFF